MAKKIDKGWKKFLVATSLCGLIGCSAFPTDENITKKFVNYTNLELGQKALNAEFGDASGVKNAYITDEDGKILHTLITDGKINREEMVWRTPVVLLEGRGDNFVVRRNWPRYSAICPIRDSSKRYFLVVEPHGLFRKTKVDDSREGVGVDEKDKERILLNLN